MTIKITKNKTIHFVGIGGAGMSAIARIFLEKNMRVTGSDLKESVNTIRLKDFGAKIFYSHEKSNIREADVVVLSSAIETSNEEYAQAKQLNIPILKRAELLGHLMDSYGRKIAITGTHGKTTTTSMTACLLSWLGFSPTYLIGADMNDFGGNAALGTSQYFVAESDESDGSFLLVEPNIGIVTNIEEEHMNFFSTKQNLCEHYDQFMQGILHRGGYLILNSDDETIRDIAKHYDPKNVFYFGVHSPAELMAKDIVCSSTGVMYSLYHHKEKLGDVSLQVFGEHNVYNSLAALSVIMKENLSFDKALKTFSRFSGTKRRFQLVGEVNQIKVYDDYAHHPTEILATLSSTKRSFNCRIVCIFQPHRYSRTQQLLSEFSTSFEHADYVVIVPIYAANESKIEGVSGKRLAKEVSKQHSGRVEYVSKKSKVAEVLCSELKKGDIVITMGAGDINTAGKELLAQLKNKFVKSHE